MLLDIMWRKKYWNAEQSVANKDMMLCYNE